MKKKEIPQENAGQNENEKYDIFISYRRDGGWETAKHLRDILVGKKYWVFFDMNDLKNGYFNNALLHYIDECQDFIIILSPNSLDRCKESEEDWVRKELAHALKAGKNIIPVMHEKFDFPKDLPDDIKDVAYINGIRVYKDVFDAIVERIISFLKSKPHLPPEPPKPKPWKKILGIILVVLALITGGFFAFRENLTNLLKPGSGNDPLPVTTALPDTPPPTGAPTPLVTDAPTEAPTQAPTNAPTASPTKASAALPAERATETHQSGSVLKADTLLGHSSLNAYDFPVFGSEIIRRQVASVTFLDTLSGAPADAWDVSQNADGSVLAWAVPNESLYDLYIAGEGGVIAPENCKEMFCCYMYLHTITLNGAFHTENITDMSYMFSSASHIKSMDLSQFNTQKVTNMSHMFYGCLSLEELNISSFDTSNVTNMDSMFFGAPLKELDLHHFNTAKVTNMTYMFCGCDSLTVLDLSGFQMSRVYAASMFQSCDHLETVVLGKIDGLYSVKDMFYNSFMVSDLYFNGTEEAWAACGIAAELPEDVQVHFFSGASAPSEIAEKAAARKGSGVLMDDTLSDYAVYVSSDFTVLGSEIKRKDVVSITFVDRLSAATENAWDVSWDGDGSVLAWVGGYPWSYDLYIAADGGVTAPKYCRALFSGYRNVKTIDFGNAFHTESVKDMSYMFAYDTKLESLDLGRFSTANVISMADMFYSCQSLKELDISSFDTSNVRTMLSMFSGAQSLTALDVKHFNTAKVKLISSMFFGCKSLKSMDASAFDLSEVTSVSSMFQGCAQLETLTLGRFIGEKNQNVSNLLSGCTALAHVYYDGTKEVWESSGLAAELPEGVQVHLAAGESAE